MFIDLPALLQLVTKFQKNQKIKIEKKDKLLILVLMLKTLDQNVMFQILLDMLMMINPKKRNKNLRKMTKRMIEMIDRENTLNILRNVSTS